MKATKTKEKQKETQEHNISITSNHILIVIIHHHYVLQQQQNNNNNNIQVYNSSNDTKIKRIAFRCSVFFILQVAMHEKGVEVVVVVVMF